MLKNNDKIMMSPELFHTVYANPRVMYNFATYIKVATQGFARFHTANKFFIAYMNSRAFDHLEDALSEKQAKDL